MEPEASTLVNTVKYLSLGSVLIVTEILTSLALNWGLNIKVKGSPGPIGPDDDSYFSDEDDFYSENGRDRVKAHVYSHTFFMAPMLYLPQMCCLLLYLVLSCTGCGRRLWNPAAAEGAGAEGGRHLRNGQIRPRNRRVEQDMQYRAWIFILPALFNYSATCLLYVGYTLTYKSSTILFKGTILFFTSLLSVAFLGRNMNPRMWTGVVVGIIGLANLGINDYFFTIKSDYDTNGIVAGDLLIVMAQIMYSIQAVYEQKILTRYTNLSALETLGYEGLWGFVLSFVLVIIFSFVDAGAFSHLPGHMLEHPIDAFKQMQTSWHVTLIVIGMMVCNTIHYFVALLITKSHGATPRMVINSVAYATTWGILLALGWETKLRWIYPGFALVFIGFLIYFDLLFMQIFQCIRKCCCPGQQQDDQAFLIPVPINADTHDTD